MGRPTAGVISEYEYIIIIIIITCPPDQKAQYLVYEIIDSRVGIIA